MPGMAQLPLCQLEVPPLYNEGRGTPVYQPKATPAKVVRVGGVASDQLQQYVERIERLEDEKRDLADHIKDVYQEAKGNGFDVKALREIVRLRKLDPNDVDEQESVLYLYKQAMGMLQD